MSAKSSTEITEKEELINDLEEKIAQPEETIKMDKLAELRAKNQAKQMEQKMAKKETKKERSINLGVIGSGQCGGNIAATFYQQGYDAVAINTAMQDLKALSILPDNNKLHLNYSLGGAARELELGRLAAETHRDAIKDLIDDKLASSQINVLCLSLGGGSGAGSCEILIDILLEIGKPVVVMTVLPMDSDDSFTKHNALETLSKLAKMAQGKKIQNLIVADNAKIEAIYHNVSQIEFFDAANKAIVEPIDLFNTLSAMPSSVKPLDPMEWARILTDGEGLSVYGELSVADFKEDTAIAEAVINNLNSNLLSGGFDLKQAKYVGIIIAANKEVWQAIPSSSVNYAMAMINENCPSAQGVFKGIYATDMSDNVVKVYSFFSGLGLPSDRVEQLKKEAKAHTDSLKNKNEQRNLSLNLDTGKEEAVSQAQKIKDKIAAKTSAFGKFTQAVVQDRRK